MKRLLVALNDIEKNDFLAGNLEGKVREMFSGARWITTPLKDASAWEHELGEYSPEILVSAWSTPALPVSWLESGKCTLKYVCHLPGSVKKLIPRTYLEKGLLVSNWGNSISPTISESALMFILCALRRTSHWHEVMHHEKGWKKPDSFSQSLFDRRIGLHGFGAIGQAFVPLVKPFRCEVWAFSPSVPDHVFKESGVHRASSLEELFSSCGIILELAANTPKNYRCVTEKHLRLIPDPHVFVNVGRGAVVDEDALLRVAREGKLQVGLDVFEKEPLSPDSPFRGIRNIMLIPHMAGPTPDRRCDSGEFGLQNLARYLKGKSVESVVTLEIFDRAT